MSTLVLNFTLRIVLLKNLIDFEMECQIFIKLELFMKKFSGFITNIKFKHC